jgi:hypothetical protein
MLGARVKLLNDAENSSTKKPNKFKKLTKQKQT